MTAPAGRTALFPIGPTDPLRFAADSPERDATAKALDTARNTAFDVPNLIGDREVRTGVTAPVVTPHEHKRQLGTVHYAGPAEAHQAIDEPSDTVAHSVGGCDARDHRLRGGGRLHDRRPSSADRAVRDDNRPR